MKTTRLLACSLVTMLCAASCTATSMRAPAIENRIEVLLHGFRGDVGIYARNLRTGATFARHADELFPTASVFKLAVLVELHRRVHAGELTLAERRRVSRAASRHGTGVLKHLSTDAELSVSDLSRLMMIFSDNVATDTLMETLDAASVTQSLRNLGLQRTTVSANVTAMHYGMMDVGADTASAELDAQLTARARAGTLVPRGFADRSTDGNVATPREMGQLLAKLHAGEVVSAEASRSILDLMRLTADRTVIPRHLSPDVIVAHKSGGTWRVKADVGIVYTDDGPIALALFAYCEPNETRKSKILAHAAAELVAALGTKPPPSSPSS